MTHPPPCQTDLSCSLSTSILSLRNACSRWQGKSKDFPESERANRQHHLRDLKVTLIRKILSDHLAYINLAREWLTFDDLETIHSRKLGAGRIDSKSAGMLLAYRILCDAAEEPIRKQLQIPESYYLSADLMYTFMAMNGLIHWHDQKYKPEDIIRGEFQQLENEFLKGCFPRKCWRNYGRS